MGRGTAGIGAAVLGALVLGALVLGPLVLGPLAVGAADNVTADSSQPPESQWRLVEQGRYLAVAGDCISCHTRANGEPFSGGRPLHTPFGVIYSANITPHTKTGIGDWSEQQFGRALREGLAPDGVHLYPAFPYTSYTKITDQDLHSLYAYLQSVKPVNYTPPRNELPFPFSVRALLAGWKMMFFEQDRYSPDPSRTAEWNRGAYLTQGLGHCGACHTPRNILGAERPADALTGGDFLDEIGDEVVNDKITPLEESTVRAWSAPNLTSAPSGLGSWSVDAIAAYLKTGHTARAGAFGPMSEVIGKSTSQLTDQDVHAMAVYLKSLPPATQNTRSKPVAGTLAAGEIVYTTRCADCHLPTGLGMPRKRGRRSIEDGTAAGRQRRPAGAESGHSDQRHPVWRTRTHPHGRVMAQDERFRIECRPRRRTNRRLLHLRAVQLGESGLGR